MRPFQHKGIAVVAALLMASSIAIAASSGYWYYEHRYYPKKVLANAKKILDMNLTFLALDEIEPYYRDFPKNEDTCDTFIKAYHRAGLIARVAWWSEACLVSNVQIPAVYLGLAAVQEQMGNSRDAISILMPQAQRFDTSVQIPYEVYRLLEKESGVGEDAIEFLIQAQSRADKRTLLAREPLKDLITQGKWELAQKLVDGIANHPASMQDVVTRTLIAQVYRHNGEVAMARRFEVVTSKSQPPVSK